MKKFRSNSGLKMEAASSLLFLFALVTAACVEVSSPIAPMLPLFLIKPPPPSPAPTISEDAVRSVPSSNPHHRTMTKEDKEKEEKNKAKDLLQRASKIERTLRTLDPKDFSDPPEGELSEIQKILATARKAIEQVQSDHLNFAQELVDKAEGDLEKLLKEQKDENNAIEKEKEKLVEAASKCGGQTGGMICRKLCENGDQPACLVFAERTASGTGGLARDIHRAVDISKKTCEAGLRSGCVLNRGFIRMAREFDSKLDELWSEVARHGDDIAKGRYLASFAAKHSPARSRAAIARIEAHMKMKIKDEFCPARKSFLTISSVFEFQKRSKTHCSEDPPVGTGLGGAEVLLKTECMVAFAIDCS